MRQSHVDIAVRKDEQIAAAHAFNRVAVADEDHIAQRGAGDRFAVGAVDVGNDEIVVFESYHSVGTSYFF